MEEEDGEGEDDHEGDKKKEEENAGIEGPSE